MAELPPVIRSRNLADQVTDILRERILARVYPPDQRMPSEAQLAEEFHVSRSSLRTALASLAAEGHIRRRHGDGTYPCPPNFRVTLRSGSDWDIERQIEHSGRAAAMRILSQGFVTPDAEEARRLGLAGEALVYSIRRLFLADDLPVALIDTSLLAEGLSADIPASEAALPPQRFLELYQEHRARDGEMRFRAIAADAELAALLEVIPGAPLLSIDAVYFDASRQPLMVAHELYRGDQGFEMETGLFGA
ncbi:MAG TPA: GntR family transcriptional regulator [Rectinemataceae bacterium]|nr:GntR family transcriptional regulator [Rectinemataceae bacterium]